MKKPRIVIDASSALPLPGRFLDGIGRTTVELIRSLEKLEALPFDITLFSQRLKADRLQRYNFASPQRFLPLPRWSRLEWVRSRLPIVEMVTGGDLLHIPYNYAPVYNRSKTVVTIHDAMFLVCPEDHLHVPEQTRKTVELARSCQAVISCSQHSKDDLVRYADIDPDKIHVCHWGYDKQQFYPMEDKAGIARALADRYRIDAPFFLSVSCDVGRKNSPLVVKEFLKFAEADGEDHLVMVWRNPPDDVKQIVASHPDGHRIHFISGVSDDDLRLLYNGATALLFPSRYEGFGLPILEAMGCGTLAVTTRISSLPEVGGDAAIYVDLDDENALLNVMTKFKNQEFDSEYLVARSLAQAARFSWDDCAKKTLEVYLKCLN